MNINSEQDSSMNTKYESVCAGTNKSVHVTIAQKQPKMQMWSKKINIWVSDFVTFAPSFQHAVCNKIYQIEAWSHQSFYIIIKQSTVNPVINQLNFLRTSMK